MTAPRIISAAEARALLEAGRLEQGPRLDLLLSAPDLAASVVALHAEVERATAAERARIAAWLRRKAMVGITAGLPETPTLLALLAYADAIANNNTED